MFSVYKEPRIVNNFLTDRSCNYLIDISKNNLKPSMVDNHRLDVNLRNSFSHQLEELDSDETVVEIVKGLINHVNKNIKNIESPTITKYLPGGFYKPHFDSPLNVSKKRLYTVIISLNDDYIGGETYFPHLNKEYKLQKGDALIFHNFDTEHNITNLSLHGGRTIKSGEKWICNIWIHDEHIHSLIN